MGATAHRRFRVEVLACRIMQGVLFLVAYCFARAAMDFHDWMDHTQKTLLVVALFILLFITLIFTLTAWVPTFLALMSLPPYVDEGNLAHFFTVLRDDHAIQFDDLAGRAVAISDHGPG